MTRYRLRWKYQGDRYEPPTRHEWETGPSLSHTLKAAGDLMGTFGAVSDVEVDRRGPDGSWVMIHSLDPATHTTEHDSGKDA